MMEIDDSAVEHPDDAAMNAAAEDLMSRVQVPQGTPLGEGADDAGYEQQDDDSETDA